MYVFDFDIKNNLPSLSQEINLREKLSLDGEVTITHMAINHQGDLAFADDKSTIYYLPKGSIMPVRLEKAHNTPILGLYMDDDFIVSGSEAPNIRMWSIKKNFPVGTSPNRKPIFEQSHSYLFTYQNSGLVYGDWRMWDRWFGAKDVRKLNIVCKGPFSMKNDTDDNYEKKNVHKYEKDRFNEGFSYELTIPSRDPQKTSDPLILPLCLQTGSADSGFIALLDQQQKILTVYTKNPAVTGKNSLVQFYRRETTFDKLQTLYAAPIVEMRESFTDLSLYKASFATPHLIIIADNKIQLAEVGTIKMFNDFSTPQIGKNATIHASAMNREILFLVVKQDDQLHLHTINLEKEIQNQKIERHQNTLANK
jgi:hypothetical protein